MVDLDVKRVIRQPAGLKLTGRTLTLLRHYPIDPGVPSQFIVFVYRNGKDLAAGHAVEASAPVLNYFEGALAADKSGRRIRLNYFCGFLGHKNKVVAKDAYAEVKEYSLADIAAAAKTLNPKQFRDILQSPDVDPRLFDLAAVILGLMGDADDAALLRRWAVDPGWGAAAGVDGVLVGYCLLEPIKGPELLLGWLHRRDHDFATRYAALRVIRRLLAIGGTVDRGTLVRGLRKALTDPELVDLVVDELRRAKVWEDAAEVFKLFGSSATVMTRKAVIHYALACPGDAAKKVVAGFRKAEPELVEIQEEVFRFEQQEQRK